MFQQLIKAFLVCAHTHTHTHEVAFRGIGLQEFPKRYSYVKRIPHRVTWSNL